MSVNLFNLVNKKESFKNFPLYFSRKTVDYIKEVQRNCRFTRKGSVHITSLRACYMDQHLEWLCARSLYGNLPVYNHLK